MRREKNIRKAILYECERERDVEVERQRDTERKRDRDRKDYT